MYPFLSGLFFGLLLAVFYFISKYSPPTLIPIMLVTVAMNGLFVWKYKMTPLLTAVHFSLGFSLSSFVEIFIFSTVLKISIGSFISILALQIISNFSLTFFPGVVSGLATRVIKNTDHK